MSYILPQENDKIISFSEIFKNINAISKNVIKEALDQRILSLTSKLSSTNTIENYVITMNSILSTVRNTAKSMFIDFCKKIDDDFFNSTYRKNNYESHCLRDRTIVTIFGEVTITRRYYKSKNDGSMLFYLDKKLGLKKYDVYDPCIKSLVIDYSTTMGAHDVSKAIADICSLSFSKNDFNRIILSRQTIKNIIDAAPIINVVEKPAQKTPEELHILLDEKWIHLQGHSRYKSHTSHEVKVAVIYENATYQNHSRMVLNNVHYVTSTDGVTSLRERIMNYITEVYDLDKIKRIYVMGDGAKWIQLTPRELTFDTKTTILYLMDWFHIVQGINRITKIPMYNTRLFDHIYHNEKKKFERVLNVLIKAHPNLKKRVEDNKTYILDNWEHIIKRLDTLNKHCSMESHISHGLAAHFTEVPKAYSVDSLLKRVNQRELFLNNNCLRELFLQAYDSNEEIITIGNKEELEVYEDNILEDNYSKYISNSVDAIYTFINNNIGTQTLELNIA